MTAEERFERIEFVTAALVEERRRDREEYRQLWRDTQHKFEETAKRFEETAGQIRDLTAKMDRLAEEFRAADVALQDRIATMVSAMGAFMARPKSS
jgi:uncharacterized protein YlxW (UPF0749 family)